MLFNASGLKSLLFGFEGVSIGIWGAVFFGLALICAAIPKEENLKKSKALRNFKRFSGIKYLKENKK